MSIYLKINTSFKTSYRFECQDATLTDVTLQITTQRRPHCPRHIKATPRRPNPTLHLACKYIGDATPLSPLLLIDASLFDLGVTGVASGWASQYKTQKKCIK